MNTDATSASFSDGEPKTSNPDATSRHDGWMWHIRQRLYLKSTDVQLQVPTSPFSDETRGRLNETATRVRVTAIAERVWDLMLTSEQREALGVDTRKDAIETYRYGEFMLVCARPIWVVRAVVLIEHELFGTSLPAYKRLLRAIDGVDPVRAYLSNGHVDRSDEEDLQDDIRDAVASRQLVVLDDSQVRRLYWKGQLVKVNWNQFPQLWQFLVKLIERARSKRDVSFDEFDNCTHKHLAAWKSRLKKLLPELWQHIQCTDTGRYRLFSIERDQISVFQCMNDYVWHESFTD